MILRYFSFNFFFSYSYLIIPRVIFSKPYLVQFSGILNLFLYCI